MARTKGLLNISANWEVQVAEPFDARGLVSTIADLTDPETFKANDGNVYVYKFMDVKVKDDPTPENNGWYLLRALPHTDIANWEKVGGESFITGKVENFAALPLATASPEAIYIVLNPTGIWLINRHPAGMYRSDGVSWNYMGIYPDMFRDENFGIQNSVDTTKVLRVSAGNISTGMTRTLTMADRDYDLNVPIVTHANMLTGLSNPAYSEGRMFYDNVKKAVSYYNDEADVIVNISQELLIRVYNNTGSTISNGSAVYPTGTFNNMPTIGLANAHDKDKCRLVGIVTHDILNNSTGYVTKFGEVGGIDTSIFGVGSILYLSNLDGQITDVKPTGSSFITQIGVVKVSGVSGSIVVDINTTEFTVEASSVVGFSPTDTATLSFDDLTRTLTISPVGLDYCFYQFGDKYTKLIDTLQIPNEEGLFAIYYNLGTLTFVKNPTDAQIASLIANNPVVTWIYWNATDSKNEYFGREMHKIGMSADTHLYAHFSFGARYLNGLQPTSLLVDDTGSLDTHAQFGMSIGSIVDEDLRFVTNEIPSTTGLNIFYLSGTEANPVLRSAQNAGFSVLNTGTGRVAYNSVVGGNWSQVEAGDNTYVFMHIFSDNENNINKRVFAIQGQNAYAGLTLAREEARKEIKSLPITGLIPQERVALATIIFQTRNLYGNAVKARTVSLDTENEYVDWTESSFGNPGSTIAVTSFSDADFEIYDDIDISKLLKFQVSGLTTGTTRTLEVPNKSGRIVVDKVASVTMSPLSDGEDSFLLTKADGVTKSVSVNTLTNLLESNNNVIMKHPTDARPYMKFIRGGVKAITDGIANPDSGFITGTLINFLSTLNEFAQVNIQNYSDGPNASSDIVATANDGTNDDHYINMGINSSEFQPVPLDPLGTGIRTGYLMSTEEMHIYNTVLKPILFGTNGILRARLDENGFRVYGEARLNATTDMGANPESLTTKQYVDSSAGGGSQTVIASGASTVIDLSLGRLVRFDITAGTSPHSISFTNAVAGATYYLRVLQEQIPVNMTFPAGTIQAGGGGNTIPGVADTIQLVSVLYTGSEYMISTQRYF